jgi:hypothetical protein
MGSGYSAHTGGLGSEAPVSFFEYRFDNVTWYDENGVETGRGNLTSRYYDFGQISNAVCSRLQPHELAAVAYDARGYLVIQTVLSAQQTAADPDHPDASYLCLDNGLLTSVTAPTESRGDARCATGRIKTVGSNNFPPFNFSTGRANPMGVYPFIQGGMGDGTQLVSGEGFYLIPAVKTCD